MIKMRARPIRLSASYQALGTNLMDEDKHAAETRYVLWGLLTLMALAGVILLAIAIFGNGLSGGPS